MILYIILTQCEPNFFDWEKDWLGVSFSVVGKWIDWELRQHKSLNIKKVGCAENWDAAIGLLANAFNLDLTGGA